MRLVYAKRVAATLLRIYRRVAHIDHGPCAQCHYPIAAGDEYEAYVFALKGKIDVRKYHTFCPLEWHEEEEEFAREGEKAELRSDSAKRQAA